jgi:hypothetical protein
MHTFSIHKKRESEKQSNYLVALGDRPKRCQDQNALWLSKFVLFTFPVFLKVGLEI